MAAQPIDFDAEGRRALEAAGLASLGGAAGSAEERKWRSMHAVVRARGAPEGAGLVYIGDHTASSSLANLRAANIRLVVNCTDTLPNHHEGTLDYFRFDISAFCFRSGGLSDPSRVKAFCDSLFAAIDATHAAGGNVLVHCLAGAHRAGTTGVACVMHYAQLDAQSALLHVKSIRPIVEPIGRFPDFLLALDAARADGPRA